MREVFALIALELALVLVTLIIVVRAPARNHTQPGCGVDIQAALKSGGLRIDK